MTERLKNNLKTSEEMSLASAKKKQLFKKASSESSNNLKIISLSDQGETLCHSLDRKLFKLEKDLAYFNFAVKEIKNIIKFS